MVPRNRLLPRSSPASWVRLPNSGGMVPRNRLLPRSRSTSWVRLPNSGGMVPRNQVSPRSSFSSWVRLPNSGGIVPRNQVSPRVSTLTRCSGSELSVTPVQVFMGLSVRQFSLQPFGPSRALATSNRLHSRTKARFRCWTGDKARPVSHGVEGGILRNCTSQNVRLPITNSLLRLWKSTPRNPAGMQAFELNWLTPRNSHSSRAILPKSGGITPLN